MSLSLPLKRTRIAVYILTIISAIIGGAAEVHAIKTFNSKKSAAKHALPAGITITIGTRDMEDTIIVLLVATHLLSMQTNHFLSMLLKDWFRPYWPPRFTHPRNGVALSTRTLGFQSWYLAANMCAILAVLIPCTIFAAQRSADVKAFRGGVQLPDSFVQAEAAEIGFSGIYWHLFQVRFVVISNWIGFFLAIPSTVVSFVALSRRKRALATITSGSSDSQDSSATRHKAQGETRIEMI